MNPARSAPRQTTVVPSHDERKGASPCRVLVAEDNPVNQMVIRAMLQKLGIEPTVAADGRQAVEAVEATSFDLILMDCQMPVMTVSRRRGSFAADPNRARSLLR